MSSSTPRKDRDCRCHLTSCADHCLEILTMATTFDDPSFLDCPVQMRSNPTSGRFGNSQLSWPTFCDLAVAMLGDLLWKHPGAGWPSFLTDKWRVTDWIDLRTVKMTNFLSRKYDTFLYRVSHLLVDLVGLTLIWVIHAPSLPAASAKFPSASRQNWAT